MAWKNGFVIEYDDTRRVHLSCSDCIYYSIPDKTCSYRSLYLPIEGYDSWKRCEYFDLDPAANNYAKKKTKYNRLFGIEEENTQSKDKPESRRKLIDKLYDNVKTPEQYLLNSILKENYVELWDFMNQFLICKHCDGGLKNTGEIAIRFKVDEQFYEVNIPGRVCVKCGRSHVVKNVVLNKIKNQYKDKIDWIKNEIESE